MAFQLVIAAVIPGFEQEGLPVPSLRNKRLKYNCNALGCFYVTIVTAATLHFTGLFHLGELIDHFGEMMTWAIIAGFLLGMFLVLVDTYSQSATDACVAQ